MRVVSKKIKHGPNLFHPRLHTKKSVTNGTFGKWDVGFLFIYFKRTKNKEQQPLQTSEKRQVEGLTTGFHGHWNTNVVCF